MNDKVKKQVKQCCNCDCYAPEYYEHCAVCGCRDFGQFALTWQLASVVTMFALVLWLWAYFDLRKQKEPFSMDKWIEQGKELKR